MQLVRLVETGGLSCGDGCLTPVPLSDVDKDGRLTAAETQATLMQLSLDLSPWS